MEAVSVIASILGISSFAIELTTTLYEFGDAVTSAKEQTGRIAQNISNYSTVLELLQERLEADGPIYSQKALHIVEQLSQQSQELFDAIRKLIPWSPPWTGPKWRQKIPWALRKTKADLLVGQLEYLKSTLSLLLDVVYAGKQTYVSSSDDKRQTARAEAALYE
jgi:hypothetical protein